MEYLKMTKVNEFASMLRGSGIFANIQKSIPKMYHETLAIHYL